MNFEIRIPWLPNKQLGQAFNETFQTVKGWVLILDWDTSLLHPQWYDICSEAIDKVKSDAGIITCKTNRIGCQLQKVSNCPFDDDLKKHTAFALDHYQRNKGSIADVTESKHKLSGFFMLTHRKCYDDVNGVPDNKFLGMDNYFQDRVKEQGYKTYIMNDLYCYHRYYRLWRGIK